jgi:hypothetical protein
VDEHPKPKTTIEQLAKLPTVFKKASQEFGPWVPIRINFGPLDPDPLLIRYPTSLFGYRMYSEPVNIFIRSWCTCVVLEFVYYGKKMRFL